MPNENSLVKLPRTGKSSYKGYKEQDFINTLNKSNLDIEIATEVHLTVPHHNKPYEPDILIFDKKINLYIDIEIDEPYDGYFRFPRHLLDSKDDIRDLFFTESGWVVIRFTEKQIHEQEANCINLIHNVIESIRNSKIINNSNIKTEKQWNVNQAIRWERDNFRENYLGITAFGKHHLTKEVIVNDEKLEEFETKIIRTIITQAKITDNTKIAFDEENHIYFNPLDKTLNADYISVTTLIDRFFPFDEERYIQGKAKDENRSYEDVFNEFEKMRNEAADLGTKLHLNIENFLKKKNYNGDSIEFKYFLEFYNQKILNSRTKFEEAEKQILHFKYNVAGTVDSLFKNQRTGKYLIIDWKRSKNLIIEELRENEVFGHPKKDGFGYAVSELAHLDNSSYYKYTLQQSMYRYILEKEYNLTVSDALLIVLHEKYKTYHYIELDYLEREVKIILDSINHKI